MHSPSYRCPSCGRTDDPRFHPDRCGHDVLEVELGALAAMMERHAPAPPRPRPRGVLFGGWRVA